MWWKVGIGLFLLMVLIAGGDLAQIFIGLPIGLLLLNGAAIIHEKIFKTNPMKSSSILEILTLGVMVLGAALLAFWLSVNVIR